MTELPASWQTDPTGRHDHRYWDGTSWTDHVADAGVASLDPFEPAPPASTAPAGSSETATTAREPDPGSPASPTTASSWAAPTAAGEPAPQEPTTALPTGWGATAAAAAPGTGSDAPTEVVPGMGADAATAVTPIPETLTGTPGAGAPTGSGPGPDGAAGDGDNRRRNLLLAGAVIVVIAVIAALAISGSDSDGREAVRGRIATSLRDSEPTLSKKDANCMADRIIDHVGADRLKDVDFDADEAPGGRLGADLVDAYATAIGECGLEESFDEGSGDADDGPDLGDLGDIDKFKDLLAEQYASTLGLSVSKARCLADALGDAVRNGELDQQDAFGDFFSYLDTCDISLDELTSASG